MPGTVVVTVTAVIIVEAGKMIVVGMVNNSVAVTVSESVTVSVKVKRLVPPGRVVVETTVTKLVLAAKVVTDPASVMVIAGKVVVMID